MKTQEQLNQEYDKIMIDFKQKAFIDSALYQHNKKQDYHQADNTTNIDSQENNQKESNSLLEQFVSQLFKDFSQHFNQEYKHIYLKPLYDLPLHDIYDNVAKQSFLSVSKQLPLTFWNTTMGQDIILQQSQLAVSSVFNLPMTEDRSLFMANRSDLYTNNASDSDIAVIEAFSSMKELSKTDKIKIQENFMHFVDSFINSPYLPETMRQACVICMLGQLETLNEHNDKTSFVVDFSKEPGFLKEILSSVKFNSPFEDLNNKENWNSYFTRHFQS